MIIKWLAFLAVIALVLGVSVFIIENVFPVNGAKSQDAKHEKVN